MCGCALQVCIFLTLKSPKIPNSKEKTNHFTTEQKSFYKKTKGALKNPSSISALIRWTKWASLPCKETTSYFLIPRFTSTSPCTFTKAPLCLETEGKSLWNFIRSKSAACVASSHIQWSHNCPCSHRPLIPTWNCFIFLLDVFQIPNYSIWMTTQYLELVFVCMWYKSKLMDRNTNQLKIIKMVFYFLSFPSLPSFPFILWFFCLYLYHKSPCIISLSLVKFETPFHLVSANVITG